MTTEAVGHVDRHRIFDSELDHALDAGGLRVCPGLGDPLRIDVDPHAARTQFCGCDRDPAVATPEVVDNVSRLDLGESQHSSDDVFWCSCKRGEALSGRLTQQ